MEILREYVVVTVTAICMAVGYMVKNVIPTKAVNDYIPLIMGVLGVILNVWLNDFMFSPQILLGGLASGLASTGIYEGFKNLTKKE